MSNLSTSVELDGHTYNLRLTRRGVRTAEGMGLDMAEVQKRPMSQLPLMFVALAVSERDNRMSYAKAEKLVDELLDSGQMNFVEFVEFFGECYSELLEPTAKSKKNSQNKA